MDGKAKETCTRVGYLTVVASFLQESGAACLLRKECTLTGFLSRMKHLSGQLQCLLWAATRRVTKL